MPGVTDQAYLLQDQYRTAANLEARIALHARFSTNPYGWQRWVFDYLLDLPRESRLLELGCGSGQLWLQNAARLPAGWDITLSDLSRGMLGEAQANLQGIDHTFTFAVLDAQEIPYADDSFDAVVANHMLYHVPNRPAALDEIRRVLRPGGRLVAATNGERHLTEIINLVHRVDPTIPYQDGITFTLEVGAQELSSWFPRVELHRHDDSLVVTEAAPLIAYIQSSTRAGTPLIGETLAKLRRLIEQDLAEHGAINVTKASGLFVAWKDAR